MPVVTGSKSYDKASRFTEKFKTTVSDNVDRSLNLGKSGINNVKEKVKEKISKRKIDSLYDFFMEKNGKVINAFNQSIGEGKPNDNVAKKIAKGIKGLKYSSLRNSFKFGKIVYKCDSKTIVFKSIKFEDYSFNDFLKIVLDGYYETECVEQVIDCFKVLSKEKIVCGFLKSPDKFVVMPTEETYLKYSVKQGNIILESSNIRSIDILDYLRILTKDALPVYKPLTSNDRVSLNRSGSSYGSNQYGSSQYGNSPYGSSYGSSPYGNNGFGSSQYGTNQYESSSFGSSQYDFNPYSQNQYNSEFPSQYNSGFSSQSNVVTDSENGNTIMRFGELSYNLAKGVYNIDSHYFKCSYDKFMMMCNNYRDPNVLSQFINLYNRLVSEQSSNPNDYGLTGYQEPPKVTIDLGNSQILFNDKVMYYVDNGRILDRNSFLASKKESISHQVTDDVKDLETSRKLGYSDNPSGLKSSSIFDKVKNLNEMVKTNVEVVKEYGVEDGKDLGLAVSDFFKETRAEYDRFRENL